MFENAMKSKNPGNAQKIITNVLFNRAIIDGEYECSWFKQKEKGKRRVMYVALQCCNL